MVKRFLNGMEKDDLAVLVAFQKYMAKKVDRLIILKRPKNQIRFTKMARTYAPKINTRNYNTT